MTLVATMLKPRLIPFQLPTMDKASKSTLFFLMLFSFLLLLLSHGSITAAADAKTTRIGAIIDVNSHIGKEQKIGMEIAVQNFKKTSTKNKLALHFRNPGKDPLQAAYAAEELIKEKQVEVIVGMETWNEAALVAGIGNRAQVPVLSLAAAAIPPPLAAVRWPFLVQIAPNGSKQVNCIAAILHSYKWRRVIAIYESDTYGGDSGMLALLSEALQSSGTEIEHRLVFPPFSPLSDPEGFVHKEVTKILHKQSRVFLVLQSSISLATHLFREAKNLGLVERDSAWIITDAVSSLLDSVNTSVISNMQGALGIQTFYSEENQSFLDFKGHFQKFFRLEYPEEDHSKPGIQALRAYDSISTIGKAVQKLGTSKRTPKMLLESILSSNFTGLSGDIRFDDGELSQFPTLRIINVIGKMYNELGFWTSKLGFSDSHGVEESGEVNRSMVVWAESVNWPGKLRRVPKGWAMPTDAKPMKIGVPGRTSFQKFVKVVENSNEKKYFGFCIDVFHKVLEILEQRYSLPYEFEAFNGSYDELVHRVNDKTYDAVVGEVTILADRSRYVEFTQPFVESGLTMIVPVKPDEAKAWMFMKPFTKELWIVTGLVMIYTMVIVWFLEHQSNPEFRGPWKNQLSNALWFTFSSLFFSHREKIHSNYTKVVVVVWLFVVFIVTSSYTASLTSMLTVPHLQPNITDIEWLKRTNATVGCDGDSFVKNYLKNVLEFKAENIKNISSEYDYPREFESGSIAAAFLELPYEKVFIREYCDRYTITGPTYRLGGWGFVFQEGSPIASDVSEAILTISENGELKKLEEKWFNTLSVNCSTSDSTTTVDSLNLQSFWGLYLISGATSTACFLFFLLRLLKDYRHQTQANQGNITPSSKSLWSKMVRFARYFHYGEIRSPSIAHTQDGNGWSSSSWELVSPSEASEHVARPTEIEIPTRTG